MDSAKKGVASAVRGGSVLEDINNYEYGEDEDEVLDETTKDETVVPESYDITSFGSDPDVEGLVRRLNRGDLVIPQFQRNYCWSLKEASRFVESLLLGLPVPGVFLAVEPESNRQIVIDGQQRLKTLQFYCNGYFNPSEDSSSQRVFALKNVQPQFEGLTFKALPETNRLAFEASVIHATIIKQDKPSNDDTSIYHVFERLNNGGRRLSPQEIRAALYHGPLLDTVRRLNSDVNWRTLFGKEHLRLKDQELILRFIALTASHTDYKKPMGEFLNLFAQKNRYAAFDQLKRWEESFQGTISMVHEQLGSSAFRIGTSLNAAVFDSVMVGLNARLHSGKAGDKGIATAYNLLLEDPVFRNAVSRATSDEKSVQGRIGAAIRAFGDDLP